MKYIIFLIKGLGSKKYQYSPQGRLPEEEVGGGGGGGVRSQHFLKELCA